MTNPLRQIGAGIYASHKPDATDGGCTTCHTEQTVIVCGCCGRRCSEHAAHDIPEERQQ